MHSKRKHPAQSANSIDPGRMGHDKDDTREVEENLLASSQDHSDDDERLIDSGEERGDDAGLVEHR